MALVLSARKGKYEDRVLLRLPSGDVVAVWPDEGNTPGQVRLCFEAPQSVTIMRAKVLAKMLADKGERHA